ncbi:MAG: hypothetical protein M3N51_08450 [Actinomycetota bacterium]|nr:hypothetical protein [Actinomycetota bacterium]
MCTYRTIARLVQRAEELAPDGDPMRPKSGERLKVAGAAVLQWPGRS